MVKFTSSEHFISETSQLETLYIHLTQSRLAKQTLSQIKIMNLSNILLDPKAFHEHDVVSEGSVDIQINLLDFC